MALGTTEELVVVLCHTGGGVQDGIGGMPGRWGLRWIELCPVGESVGFGVKVGDPAPLGLGAGAGGVRGCGDGGGRGLGKRSGDGLGPGHPRR